jgi:hypothetical protein
MTITKIYYQLRPFIPRYFQIYLRRQLAARKRMTVNDTWPINEQSGAPPRRWTAWPGEKRFALVLTHDVDTARGQDRCRDLMEMERKRGFKSSFNFVPRRYTVSAELREYLTSNGFEVGVHGVCHDGKLYSSRNIFSERAVLINSYLNEWNSVGFRSPSMHHNLNWIHDLNITYDSSTFDTDPFEPHSDGVNTIFPFWVSGNSTRKGYVELPYTLAQDFTLFILLRERNIDIWKRKLAWIAEKGGMALLNTHPDYMNFNGAGPGLEEFSSELYGNFLEHIISEYKDQYWHVLPKDMASFWRSRCLDVTDK